MAPLSLLLPRRCAGCETTGPALCDACRVRLRRVGPTGCARCGAPGPWMISRCASCPGRRPAFATARTALVYDDLLRQIVAAWKERGRRDLTETLAALAAEELQRPPADCLTFVPGDRERGLVRGHVPAEGLARSLGRRWQTRVEPLLVRVGPPRARQAGLGRVERRGNVRGAFRAAPVVAPPDTVCLVDDVYTTGATVAACAAVLRRAGVGRVDVVALARVVG